VIPFPVSQSALWRFFDYAGDIENWYRGLSEEGRDIFGSLLKANAKISVPLNWLGSKMLQGACKKEGIWEWCFRADGVQQRLLGVFGKEPKTAIFLLGCSHKGKIYRPADCLETAIRRAKRAKNLSGAEFNARPIRTDL
jgi:hypothetical protein